MESTDKSLVDAHCKGDPEAFAELVRRYGGSVLGFLTAMTGNRDQAEDFFQETFKRVHEKAHTLRGDRFRPWLFRIASRVAIDGFRRRGRICVVSLNERIDCVGRDGEQTMMAGAVDNSYNPSDEAAKAEQKEQVRRAIGLLPAKQRATLVLAYYQQLSYSEVAMVMGCSIGTVKTQMYRALRTLAGKLPDFSGGGQ